MEAPLTADQLIRPWKTATLVASLLAAAELVLLLVAGAVLIAKPLAHAVQHHAAQVAAAKPAKHHAVAAHKHHAVVPVHRRHVVVKAHPRAAMRVLVLNGNGRNGAAHAEASRLQSLGYRISGAADAKRHDYATTLVMYSPGYRSEGLRLARDLGVHAVGPLDGVAHKTLAGGQLAVILGANS